MTPADLLRALHVAGVAVRVHECRLQIYPAMDGEEHVFNTASRIQMVSDLAFYATKLENDSDEKIRKPLLVRLCAAFNTAPN